MRMPVLVAAHLDFDVRWELTKRHTEKIGQRLPVIIAMLVRQDIIATTYVHRDDRSTFAIVVAVGDSNSSATFDSTHILSFLKLESLKPSGVQQSTHVRTRISTP